MCHQITVSSLSHKFGKTEILSDTHIACSIGEVTGVFGRNGTGKSTLFKILFGTLKADQAQIYLDDQLVQPGCHLNKVVAYHPQEIMLPKGMQVNKLITMYVTNADKQNKIFYAAGIHEMQHKKVRALSLGQQRYLQFLLVINSDQPFILLDEPFSMVEPLFKDLIKQKITEYKTYKGFLITDHYYLDVLEIADKVKLIKDGQIIPVTTKEDLVQLAYLSERSI